MEHGRSIPLIDGVERLQRLERILRHHSAVFEVVIRAPGERFDLKLEVPVAGSDGVQHLDPGIDHFGADMLVNMSVWDDLESLRAFTYDTAHAAILRRRKEWFDAMTERHMVLWWIPAGHEPTLAEAEERLSRLRESGPTAEAFTFREPFDAPGSTNE